MKKIVFIGASTPNLYGASKLKKSGFDVVVYERNAHHANPQRRQLPTSLLRTLGLFMDSKNEFEYVVLSTIKNHLAKKLTIRYNTHVEVDLDNEQAFLGEEEVTFDHLIINTGHKQHTAKSEKILLYDYLVEDTRNHFAGKSLTDSIKKMDKIIERIINTP